MKNLAENWAETINMRARRRFVVGAALAVGGLSLEDARAQNKAQQAAPAAATGNMSKTKSKLLPI